MFHLFLFKVNAIYLFLLFCIVGDETAIGCRQIEHFKFILTIRLLFDINFKRDNPEY